MKAKVALTLILSIWRFTSLATSYASFAFVIDSRNFLWFVVKIWEFHSQEDPPVSDSCRSHLQLPDFLTGKLEKGKECEMTFGEYGKSDVRLTCTVSSFQRLRN